jgi:hypothetical protein
MTGYWWGVKGILSPLLGAVSKQLSALRFVTEFNNLILEF